MFCTGTWRLKAPIAALLLAALSACDQEEPLETTELAVEFGTGTAVLISQQGDTLPIGVEIAESPQQRALGLMHRSSLASDSGMVFLFPEEQPPEEVFWMYNTLIPLSIAFIDAQGRIGSIRHMEPCTSPFPQYCANYAAGVPFNSALEVNQGFFEQNNLGVGDRVILQTQ